MQRIEEKSKKGTHGALILTPRKELVTQIYDEIVKLDPQNKIRVCKLGSIDKITPQITHPVGNNSDIEGGHFEELKSEFQNQNTIRMINWRLIDILITTPSQLENTLDVQVVQKRAEMDPKYVILDEFDEMMKSKADTKQIKNIVFGLNKKERVYSIVGATMLNKIQGKNTEEALKEWIPSLEFSKSEGFLKVNPKVQHEPYNVQDLSEQDKMLFVFQLIKKMDSNKVLIYCKSTQSTVNLASFLNKLMIPTLCLHSGMSSIERTEAFEKFKGNSYVAMVITDVGSRGLDFPEMKLVIQFNFAEHGIALLHRYGRTGRMAKGGKVISFVMDKDTDLFQKFEEIRKEGGSFERITGSKGHFKRSLDQEFQDEVHKSLGLLS